ncbi:putative short chain type dehydrogenase [Apiosordaria backusii]|uniref:Short chain type dehydrogenase n=1 Tax=Apiosordaria backusii TaxID=314023 RepID=A0AA40DGN9_9PEZI|nr:putative short chain type dehydrogenase [Apiosordaria backusii]
MSSSTSAPTASSQPVWLVTGASSGLGLAVAIEAAKTATVVALGRDQHGLEVAAKAGCRTVQLDLRASADHISTVLADVVKTAGRVDVLVNAAGYILEGAVEETSEQELEDIFTTNVFAPIRLARAVLPHMRQRGSGVIFNVAGIGGFSGSPNAGAYCSSKAALATLTEALQRETGPLGVRVCLVQLGHFRTSFLKAGHRLHTSHHIADYDPVLEPLRKAFNGLNGQQPGDPVKAAKALVDIVGWGIDKIPMLLALGSDVPAAELSAHEAKRKAMLTHEKITNSTDLEA